MALSRGRGGGGGRGSRRCTAPGPGRRTDPGERETATLGIGGCADRSGAGALLAGAGVMTHPLPPAAAPALSRAGRLARTPVAAIPDIGSESDTAQATVGTRAAAAPRGAAGSAPVPELMARDAAVPLASPGARRGRAPAGAPLRDPGSASAHALSPVGPVGVLGATAATSARLATVPESAASLPAGPVLAASVPPAAAAADSAIAPTGPSAGHLQCAPVPTQRAPVAIACAVDAAAAAAEATVALAHPGGPPEWSSGIRAAAHVAAVTAHAVLTTPPRARVPARAVGGAR